jgi:hypothetical protein
VYIPLSGLLEGPYSSVIYLEKLSKILIPLKQVRKCPSEVCVGGGVECSSARQNIHVSCSVNHSPEIEI